MSDFTSVLCFFRIFFGFLVIKNHLFPYRCSVNLKKLLNRQVHDLSCFHISQSLNHRFPNRCGSRLQKDIRCIFHCLYCIHFPGLIIVPMLLRIYCHCKILLPLKAVLIVFFVFRKRIFDNMRINFFIKVQIVLILIFSKHFYNSEQKRKNQCHQMPV